MDTMQNPYELSIADVAQANISDLTVAKIITQTNQNVQQNSVSGEDLSAGLLAAILKRLTPKNAKYNIYPFTVQPDQYQQIVPENKNRVSLIVQTSFDLTDVPSIDGRVFFGEGPINAQDAPPDIISRSLSVSTSATQNPVSLALSVIQFNPPPTNPVCIVNFSVSSKPLTGVVIEGVMT